MALFSQVGQSHPKLVLSSSTSHLRTFDGYVLKTSLRSRLFPLLCASKRVLLLHKFDFLSVFLFFGNFCFGKHSAPLSPLWASVIQIPLLGSHLNGFQWEFLVGSGCMVWSWWELGLWGTSPSEGLSFNVLKYWKSFR